MEYNQEMQKETDANGNVFVLPLYIGTESRYYLPCDYLVLEANAETFM